MSARGHLRLVRGPENSTEPVEPRQMVLTYGALDAEARGAQAEPVVTANELVAARLEAIARGLRAAVQRPDGRQAG